eukprot:gene29156-35187_t
MVNITFRKLEDFGSQDGEISGLENIWPRRRDPLEDLIEDENFHIMKAHDVRPTYVPYVDVPKPEKMPNIVHIVDIHSDLDLGMEPLQKIVHKMRRLAAEGSQVAFDKGAARAAGIMPYCTYLVGDNPKPKPRRSLVNSKVRVQHSSFKTK